MSDERYKDYDFIFKTYNNSFIDSHMEITREEIVRRIVPIKKCIQKLGKTSPIKKASFLHYFSLHEWQKLVATSKKDHSPYHCYGCINTHSYYLNLITPSKQLKQTGNNNEIKIILPNAKPCSSRNPLTTITKQVFNSVYTQFTRSTGVDFAEAQVQTKSLGLTKVKSKKEKQQIRRNYTKTLIKNIENQLSETSMMRLVYTLYIYKCLC